MVVGCWIPMGWIPMVGFMLDPHGLRHSMRRLARNTVVPMKSKKGLVVPNRSICLSLPEPWCPSYPGLPPSVAENLSDGETLLPLLKRRRLAENPGAAGAYAGKSKTWKMTHLEMNDQC